MHGALRKPKGYAARQKKGKCSETCKFCLCIDSNLVFSGQWRKQNRENKDWVIRDGD